MAGISKFKSLFSSFGKKIGLFFGSSAGTNARNTVLKGKQYKTRLNKVRQEAVERSQASYDQAYSTFIDDMLKRTSKSRSYRITEQGKYYNQYKAGVKRLKRKRQRDIREIERELRNELVNDRLMTSYMKGLASVGRAAAAITVGPLSYVGSRTPGKGFALAVGGSAIIGAGIGGSRAIFDAYKNNQMPMKQNFPVRAYGPGYNAWGVKRQGGPMPPNHLGADGSLTLALSRLR